MRRFALVTAFLALFVGALACSGDPNTSVGATPDEGGTPAVDGASLPDEASAAPVKPGPPGTASSFCKGTYELLYDSYDACCTAGDKTTLRYQLIFNQLGIIKESCSPQLEASVAAGRISVDTQAHDACVSAYTSFFAGGTCGKDLTPFLDMTVAGCDKAFVGRQDLGLPCLRDYECKDGLTCIGFAGNTDGSCKKPPATGADCGAGKGDAGGGDAIVAYAFGDHPRCEVDAVCNATAHRCVARVAANGACAATEQCAAGLTCLLGRCDSGMPANVGGACKSNHDCNGMILYCAAGDAGVGSVCAKKNAAGTPCTAAGPLGGSACSGQCAVVGDAAAAPVCVSFCGSG